jgi:hypothetical protein
LKKRTPLNTIYSHRAKDSTGKLVTEAKDPGNTKTCAADSTFPTAGDPCQFTLARAINSVAKIKLVVVSKRMMLLLAIVAMMEKLEQAVET